jgi:hypothetical protein
VESGLDVPITSVTQLEQVLKVLSASGMDLRTRVLLNLQVVMPIPESNPLNVGMGGGGLSTGPLPNIENGVPTEGRVSWLDGMTGLGDQEEGEGAESDANSNPSEG